MMEIQVSRIQSKFKEVATAISTSLLMEKPTLQTTLNRFAVPKPKSEEPFVPIDVVRIFYNKPLNFKRKRRRSLKDITTIKKGQGST